MLYSHSLAYLSGGDMSQAQRARSEDPETRATTTETEPSLDTLVAIFSFVCISLGGWITILGLLSGIKTILMIGIFTVTPGLVYAFAKSA